MEFPATNLDYRVLLKDALLDRKQTNPQYSLRAMARDLAVSPSYLSSIFSGRRNLPTTKAHEFARALSFQGAHRKYFLGLVKLESLKDEEDRREVMSEISQMAQQTPGYHLEIDIFRAVSSWYCGAIVALVDTEGFNPDPKWIGKRLEIMPLEAELAIDRLTRLGILKKRQGSLVKSKPLFITEEIPSNAIRKFHKKMFNLCAASLDSQTLDRRHISGMTFAANPEKLPLAKKKIAAFAQEIRELMKTGKQSAVFQLSLAMFRLDRDVNH
jgi:uncharacterized protein (TIGR02147 family)